MNFIKLCIPVTLFFSLLSCTGTDPYENAKGINSLAKELVDERWAQGLSFQIKVDTFIDFTNHYGFTNQKSKIPVHKESKFRIASITKPITATAILQLIESGQLSENDKINRFFPNFPKADQISIYHLLSHTSGIPNWWGWDGELPKGTPENFPMCPHPHRYLEKLDNYTSLFEPGSHHAYSNSGYVILGEIIEIISGMSYEEYIKQNILNPAGMEYTELEFIENPKEDWIDGYAWDDFNFVDPQVYHMPFSAGGLRSTTADLMKFMKALRDGKLVSHSTFKKMTSYARLNDGRFTYENLYSDNGPHNFPKNIKKFGYGLGFQIVENFGVKVIFHGGDIAGFNSVLMYIPNNNVTLAILSNTENGIMSKLQKIEKLATSIEINNNQG